MTKTKTQSGCRHRRRGAWLGGCAVAAVMAASLAACAARYCVGPRIARRRLMDAMDEVWDGRVRLDEVEVDLSGRVRLVGVELLDRKGRCWVRLAQADLDVDGLFGRTPVVRKIDLRGADCRLHLTTEGAIAPPVRRPGLAATELVDLRRLRATDVTIHILPSAGADTTLDEIELQLERAGGSYRLRIAAPPAAAAVTVNCRQAGGKFIAELADGRLGLIPSAEAGPSWSGLLRGAAVEGTVAFAGRLEYDPAGAGALAGEVRLSRPAGLKIALPARGIELQDVRWERFVVTADRMELHALTAAGLGGTLRADLAADDWADPAERRYRLNFTTSQMDMGRMTEAVGATLAEELAGRVDLALQLNGKGSGWSGLIGKGRLRVDGGDFDSLPLMAMISRQLRLAGGPAAGSSAYGVFDIAGRELRIRRAAVTSTLSGIQCTEGTVNLETGYVDVVVVGGTYLTMNRFAGLLPGVLKSKLLARRVRGKWNELTGEDFAPLPSVQIADSSVFLFLSLARNQGRLPAGLIEGFGKLFRSAIPER